MRFLTPLLAFLSVVGFQALASPAGLDPRGLKTSLEPPSNILPFPHEYYRQAAALVQQDYCIASSDVPGLEVGDAVLLNTTGNGDQTQRVTVWHSASLGVTVSYMGTNITSLNSIWHDVKFVLLPPRDELGLPAGALVDTGFQDAWWATWPTVKSMIDSALKQYPGSKLTITGHSLGAAAASFASLALGSEKVTRMITFGQPRVGNSIWADHFDSVFGSDRANYFVNGVDWVPHVVPRLLAQHFSGQVWQSKTSDASTAMFYPGQENIFGADTVLLPPINLDAHQGWYLNTRIGSTWGPCPAKVGHA